MQPENKNLNGEKSSKRKNNEDYSALTTQINTNKATMAALLETIESYKYNVMDDIRRLYTEMGYTFYNKILNEQKNNLPPVEWFTKSLLTNFINLTQSAGMDLESVKSQLISFIQAFPSKAWIDFAIW